ncbi:uncharacterized protein LOC129940025 [Eupeodes corollae]|uniref:uncharacterized protein LOC129940025 n=1 Tax=Eupeodes corollae TaxID=290404 RepID=UPI0024917232|nr:uncharacterized protein LOC129940025 [Eupeodes corollae]
MKKITFIGKEFIVLIFFISKVYGEFQSENLHVINYESGEMCKAHMGLKDDKILTDLQDGKYNEENAVLTAKCLAKCILEYLQIIEFGEYSAKRIFNLFFFNGYLSDYDAKDLAEKCEIELNEDDVSCEKQFQIFICLRSNQHILGH